MRDGGGEVWSQKGGGVQDRCEIPVSQLMLKSMRGYFVFE
jgi:hypothetical protein